MIEGAIVLRDAGGNEMTLASQFETGKFLNEGRGIENLGQKSASEVAENFSKVSGVAPELFSSIKDAANENQGTPQKAAQDGEPTPVDAKQPVAEDGQEFDANGATDKNGDSEVDGTVEEAPADAKAKEAAPEGEEAKEAALEEPVESDTKPTIQVIEDPLGVNQEVLPNNSLGNTQTVTAAVANEAIDSFENGNGNSNNGNGQKRGLLKQLLADQNNKTDTTTDNLDDPGNLATGSGSGGGSVSNTAPQAKDFAQVGIPAEALSGTDGYTMRFYASEVFSDLDGDPLTFTLDLTSESYLNSQRGTLIDSGPFWDAGNGILTLSFLGSIVDGAFPTITIRAEDGSGEHAEVHLDVSTVDADHVMTSSDGVNILGTAGDVTAIDGTVSLAQTNAAGVTIYRANTGVTQIGHDNTEFHGATNNDTVNLTASTNDVVLYLEHGNDTVDVQAAQDDLEIYGMGGNDTFTLNNAALNHLETGDRNTVIDGGRVQGDLDILRISNGGNINFMNIIDQGNEIKNIEEINATNGSGNLIRLDFNSVLEMTEGENRLHISGDSNDGVQLLNFGTDGVSGNFIGFDGADSVYQYSNGSDTITLVVDADIVGGTNGGVAVM